ncbi:hypothetical protein DFH06DRAFT_1156930 [Mycena polygramma]|nr:hypothetical protein DFH06DRAFT_1156930 [Mycena polygramma]
MDGADDAPFDDLSPDEDERRAQDYLRGPTTGSAPQIQDDFAVDPRLTSGTSENPAQGYSRDDDESVTGSAPVNVLQKHWDRNRPPRIPNPQNMLLQPRPFSRSGSSASGSLTRAPSPSPSAASEPSNSRSGSRSRSKSKSRASQSRAPRNSRNAPTADNAKPTQLRYYREAPRWYRALTKSKDLFAVYIYSECGFPTSTVADMEAGHCLKEGKRIVMEEEDEELESDFDDTKDMIKLTTDVGSSCRGDLKSFIRKIIISGYNLIPALTDVNEKTGKRYTAEERVAFCVNRVKELQKDGNWLNSGEGTDGNINHPVIEDTIRDFFYAEDGIALKYPQFFEDEVPVRTVVLVAIAVYNCLDEMQTGKLKTIKFEADRYHTKYLEILDSVQKVLEAPAAGPIYQEQLRDWASGRNRAATTSASTSSLGIRLNLG